MQDLYEMARVGPHLYQGSLRTLLLEDEMIEGMVKHGVHYQVYDAPSTVLTGRERAPRAYARLERMGARHGGIQEGVGDVYGGYGYSAIQMVLGWLVQKGVGVIPGTKNLQHLVENGPMTLMSMPRFTAREMLDVEMAVLALMKGEDLEGEKMERNEKKIPAVVMGEDALLAHGMEEISPHNEESFNIHEEGVVATFFNALRRNIRIFQVHPRTGQQLQVSKSIPPGRSGRIIVNPRDVLIAYDGHGVAVKKFLVEDNHGGRVDFSVEL